MNSTKLHKIYFPIIFDNKYTVQAKTSSGLGSHTKGKSNSLPHCMQPKLK